jgi:hypothetical protein
MHPLISYIKEDSKYLLNPDPKLEKFREYLREKNYGQKQVFDRFIKDYQNYNQDLVLKRKQQGIPKKLPSLIPKKQTPVEINDLIKMLKK